MSSGMNKMTAERNQRIVMDLAIQPGNDVCADCKARNPRWASHNIGIFICVSCAGIHRKMGTHISKVKSLTMDQWSKEQVETMKENGNLKSNAYYNPDEIKNPPPTNMIDQERDSDLEKYIRSKYQYKSFVTKKSAATALLGPSRSASSRLSSAAPTATRSQTMPPSSSASAPPTSYLSAAHAVARTPSPSQHKPLPPVRAASQPVAPPAPAAPQPPPQQAAPPTQPRILCGEILRSFKIRRRTPPSPAVRRTPTMSAPMSIQNTGLSVPAQQFTGLSASPSNPFPSMLMQQQTGMFPPRSMSLNTGLTMNGMNGVGGNTLGYVPSGSMGMLQPQPAAPSLSSGFLQQSLSSSPQPPFAQSISPGMSMHQQQYQQQQQQQQQAFGGVPSSFGQAGPSMMSASPMHSTSPMPQGSPMFPSQPLGQMQSSPMFPPQQLGQMQGSPMFPSQQLGQQGSNPFMNMQQQQQQQHMQQQQQQMQMQMQMQIQQQQQQPVMTGFQPQQPFASPSPSMFMPPGQQQPQQQPQQQQMFGQQQTNPFGAMGWQQPQMQQPTGFMGQQQSWGPGRM
ncbi:uncharacterized protein BXZ73DRAFT_89261 [Epithele typhae]|uniref:uncharacterized protein n=1 Tax=Epithele typhae TaxID=378194 RepID=UPI0020082858|nr:uncharacterized protein BXZ73DRAFT_89261 [Epithele typhae]KAH9937845.1 hypothetical protein BXZ73DRAFT_89261 [Epithele typhae]